MFFKKLKKLNNFSNKTEKGIIITSYTIKLILIFTIIFEIWQQNWLTLFLTVLTLILSFIPALIEKNYKITIPLEFEFLILVFLFGSIYLGEIGDYYNRFWWWDALLHALSAMILGIIGFTIVYIMNRESKVGVHIKSIYISIFAFTFAVSIGAIWEIFEFAMDSFFGLNMQKNGLVDTMWDLIVDVCGALIVSIAGYFYVKKVKTPLFYNLFEKIIKLNEKINSKKKKKKVSNK